MVFRLRQVTGRAQGRYQNMTGSPSRLVMKDEVSYGGGGSELNNLIQWLQFFIWQ